MEFNYFLPVNIVFGSGKVLETGELTRPYGKKALIVTGKSSAKKSGLYDKVNDSLKAAGLETALFDKVSQNSQQQRRKAQILQRQMVVMLSLPSVVEVSWTVQKRLHF